VHNVVGCAVAIGAEKSREEAPLINKIGPLPAVTDLQTPFEDVVLRATTHAQAGRSGSHAQPAGSTRDRPHVSSGQSCTRRGSARDRRVLLQPVNIIRLSDTNVLGLELAHDIGDLASIVDAETEQRAARKREIL
jgi:hypothetical protein